MKVLKEYVDYDVRKPQILKGYIVDENDDCDKQIHYLVSNGYWVGRGGKHITSYVETDQSGECIDEDKQYSRARYFLDGKKVNVFFLESIN